MLCSSHRFEELVHQTSWEERSLHVSLVYNKQVKVIFILFNFISFVSVETEPSYLKDGLRMKTAVFQLNQIPEICMRKKF